MDDITASIIVQCQTSGAAASINKLGFSLAMLGRKAIDFGMQSVSEFRATQDAAWKFGKTFANSMGSAEKAVNTFMESYNLSEKTARSMLTDTAGVLKGFGFSEKEALKLSEQVSRMGVDMASFTGYAGGAKGAAEAITAAMLGETERLKGLNTVIRMDSSEFKDLTKTIMKNKGVTEQQARAMATLQLVMDKNKDAIGDYNAEGENFTQTMNKVGETLTELKLNVGKVIYEVFGLNDAFGGLDGFLKKITAEFKKNGPIWIYEMREVFISIEEFAKNGIAGISPFFSMIITGFKNVVATGKWAVSNWEIIVKGLKSKESNIFHGLWEDLKQLSENLGAELIADFNEMGENISNALGINKLLYGEDMHGWQEEAKYLREIKTPADMFKYTERALRAAKTSAFPKLEEINFKKLFSDALDMAKKNADDAELKRAINKAKLIEKLYPNPPKDNANADKKPPVSGGTVATELKAYALARQIVYSAESRRASTRLGGEFGAMASWRAMMNQQQQQRDQKELPKNVTKATNLLEKISISLDRLKETGLIITYS